MEAKDIIFSGGINTDDEARLIPNGDYRMSKYTRSGSAESQNQGAVESMPGNLLHDNPDLPLGLNTVVGSARWIEGSSIIYMVHNSAGDHTIWSYNINDFSITLVLGNWLLGVGGTALNFQLSNKVYHTNIVDNLLYWTDGYFDSFEYNVDGLLQFNPPRKIDINKAIKYMASDGADPEGYVVNAFSTIDEAFHTMDALKCPPVFKPICQYQTNTTKQFNKLYGMQPQFSYQYVYDNNEESKWSMYSILSVPENVDFVSGRDFQDPLMDNEIQVTIETGTCIVKGFKIAYRNGDNGVWVVFKEVNKIQDGISDNITYNVVFDGNEAPKPATYTEYNYDLIPQISSCQEVLSNNSIVYGNYYADYNLLTEIDVSVDRVINNVSFNENEYKETPFSNISFFDSSDPTVATGRTRLFLAPYLTVFAGFPEVNYTFEYMEGDVIIMSLFDTSLGQSTLRNYYYEITQSDVSFPGSNVDKLNNLADSIVAWFVSIGITAYIESSVIISLIRIDGYSPIYPPGSANVPVSTCKVLRRNFAVRSLKKGSKKVFGIQYYDRGNRSGSVQNRSDIFPIELDVPFPSGEDLSGLSYPNNPYYVSAKLTINHIPPEWATHYQILVKKDELMINFQQTTIKDISVDPESPFTLLISIDDEYTKIYKGATVNHTPQKGDIVRFIKKSVQPYPNTTANGYEYPSPDYCSEYYETEVIEYNPSGGVDSGPFISVSIFDYDSIIGGFNGGIGSLIEIYTKREESADDLWFEIQDPANIGEGYVILNPHTENRYHAGNTQNQTSVLPAIVDLSYGDVWLRTRQYSTGVKSVYVDGISQLPVYPDISVIYNVQISESVYEYWRWNGSSYIKIYNYQPNIFPEYIYSWIEDYNYSDYYTSNSLGLGRFGIDDINAKRRHLKSSVIHSLPLVQDSNINGLSSFQGLGSSRYLDDTFGSINRLKQVGYTLKVLQDRKETAVYIQKSYATGGDGAGQLAYTDKVFGGINPYDTLFGTVHPGSVQLIEGDLYYFDYYTGAFIRTSNNGQNDISSGKYKFNYFTSTKATDISLDFNNYEIISMIDEQNMEYTCFFRKYEESTIIYNCRITETGYVISVINSPENLINLLPPGTSILLSGSSPTNDTYNTVVSVELVGTDDYDITVTNEVTLPSVIPFRILLDVYSTDGPVFSYLRDRWITMVDYNPTWTETLGMVNLTWDVNGQLYSHNDGAELNFYIDQKRQQIDFVMNESAFAIKRLLTMGLRSNGVFNVDSVTTPVSGSYPAMNSEIPAALFKLKEGYYWSAYLRDKTNVNLSDPYLRTIELALQNGRQLRGYVFEHTISQNSTSKVVLFSIKTTYVPSEALI